MLNRAIAGMAVGALLLAAIAFAIPQHAAAQAFGGYADTLVFSVVPQDQAVAAVSSGDIDMYAFPLDTATDKQAARDDPNINVMEALGGFHDMFVNPVAPADGSFNPFTIREIREAMHWAYDRGFVVNEITGGFAIPMTIPYVRTEPEYLHDATFFADLETTYSYDPARAKAQVDDAMSQVAGASFDTATNQWLMNGNQIDVIIVQRVEDLRFEIGAYVATEIEALGFNPVLDPSTFSEAIPSVYFSDAKIGQWGMYTEAWGTSGFPPLDDTRAPFFFNGDFGSAIWDDYIPPSSLQIACQGLLDGLYTSPNERRDLLRTCVAEGLREGIRHFLLMDIEVYAFNRRLSNTAFSVYDGLQLPFSLRTAINLDGPPGGTLYIGQPVHTGSAWNLYGGFQDLFSRLQMYQITDFGTATHPHLGGVIPFRANFAVNNVGPLDAHDVPTSALTFATSTNTFVNVSAGVKSGAYVDFDMRFGEWHHGEMMTMDDVVAKIAMLSRMASGDLAAANPNNANQIYLVRWDSSFRGFEILDADSIRIYFETYSPDESMIAGRIPIFPWYPWELDVIMAESVLANETALDDTSADLLNAEPLDLAQGATLGLFDPRLTANLANNTIPPFLSAWITSAEATTRWAALDAWRNDPSGCVEGPSSWTCNYMVSQGPYILDQYFLQPEGAQYAAKRTGYPIEQDAWDSLGPPRVPRVAFQTPPEVIQTFPATFQFMTTLDGIPYDRIQTAIWEVSDPSTERILFSGDATRSGPGTWDIELTALQTTALFEGTYEMETVVVGEETPLPVVDTLSFNSISLSSAILWELTRVIEGALTDFQETIDENTAATQTVIDAADARMAGLANLVNLVLVVAIAAVVIAVTAIGATLVIWRWRPAK